MASTNQISLPSYSINVGGMSFDIIDLAINSGIITISDVAYARISGGKWMEFKKIMLLWLFDMIPALLLSWRE